MKKDHRLGTAEDLYDFWKAEEPKHPELYFIVEDIDGLGSQTYFSNMQDFELTVHAVNELQNVTETVHVANTADNFYDTTHFASSFSPPCSTFNSFSADTAVSTKDGDTPISLIEIGDYVLGWDETTETLGWYKVTDTIHHTDEIVVHLTIDGEELETTPEHPFYVKGEGWDNAEELQQLAELASRLEKIIRA